MVLPVWAQLKYRRFRATAFAILLIARPLAAQDSADTPEARAERAFARNDCPTALLLYPSALERAQAAHDYGRLGLFYRRTGICYNRMGDPESALTAYRAGTAAAESAGDIDLQEENIHGAQLALQRLSRFSESLAEAHRELALAEQCRHPQHLVRALSAVGNVNRAVGQTGLAVQFYQRILDYSRGANFDEGIRFGLDSLAQMSSALGDPETGLRYLRQVLAVTQPDDAVAMARAHNNVGDALLALNRLKEAQAEFEAGLRFAEAPEAWMARQIILLNLGGVHHGLKQYQQARLRYQQVIELSEQHKDSDTECRSKTALSAALFDAGDAVAAEREARAAVDIARRIDNPERLFQSLGQLGTILESAGRTEEAFAALEESAGVMESLRAAAPGDPQALETVLRKGFWVYQALVEHLLDQRRNEEALRWAERAKARVLNDVLLAGGVDERRFMSAGQLRQERLLYRKVWEGAADQARSRVAIGELEFFRRQLYSQYPQLSLQRADFAPAGLPQLRTLLPDNRTALLDFFLLPHGVALFIVRNTGIQVVRRAGEDAGLAAEVLRFREQMAARDVNYKVAARALYGKLLASDAGLRGASQWVISPDGPLWDLPFQALIGPDGRHLLETHVLSYAPSLTALWEIRQREKRLSKAPLELLAMGDPTGAGAALPDAEQEVRRIGALYPAARSLVLTGAEAREDRFRQQSARAAIIHLATHAELNDANPLYSYVLLSPDKTPGDDGRLPASEILRMPLRARLAVLSACETARGQAGRGEGLLGMGWALAAAGVPASVLSQWKVDSAATGELMVAFHRGLRAARVSAAALQHAAIEVMNQPGYRHPFYWAGFIVLGDGLR